MLCLTRRFISAVSQTVHNIKTVFYLQRRVPSLNNFNHYKMIKLVVGKVLATCTRRCNNLVIHLWLVENIYHAYWYNAVSCVFIDACSCMAATLSCWKPSGLLSITYSVLYQRITPTCRLRTKSHSTDWAGPGLGKESLGKTTRATSCATMSTICCQRYCHFTQTLPRTCCVTGLYWSVDLLTDWQIFVFV